MLNGLSNTQIRSAFQASASLEKILCDEAWLRCFNYEADWAEGIDIVTYENGGGDHVYIIFIGDAILIKGFDHESDVSPYAQDEYKVWAGMYDGVPEKFLSVLNDESLEHKDVTFCYWRISDGAWSQGNVIFENNEDDGSGWLLSALTVTPEKYIEYAKNYYADAFNRISESQVYKTFKHFSDSQGD